MDTLPNNTSPVAPEQVPTPSLLDQIIQTAQESSLPGVIPPVLANSATGTGSVPP